MIEIRNDEPENGWVCLCANTAEQTGFFACDRQGEMVLNNTRAAKYLLCGRCGLIFKVKTQAVVGVNPPAENKTPRRPGQDELDELVEFLWLELGQTFPPKLPNEAFDDLISQVKAAWIAVFDDFVSMSPGYVGQVMVVVWGASPSMYEAYVWRKAKLVRSPQERVMRSEGRKVKVEVRGGVAYLVDQPPGVDVEIIDHDNQAG